MAIITKPTDLSKVWAALGDKREPSDAKKAQGWVKEIPTFQDFNWLDGRQDQAIAHINQYGIAEWDGNTEYQANKSYVQGSDGRLYQAKTTNININPVDDVSEVDWEVAFYTKTEVDTLVGQSQVAVPITLTSSYTQHVTWPITAQVKAGVLYLNGICTSGSPVMTPALSLLPDGYRPSAIKRFFVSTAPIGSPTDTTLAVCTLNPSGSLEISFPQDSNEIIIAGSIVL